MKYYPRDKKAKFQNAHAIKRFGQRTGILFTKKMRKEFIKRIQRNKNAEFLEKQSNRVTLWRIFHENNEFDVVYDKKRKTIVTIL